VVGADQFAALGDEELAGREVVDEADVGAVIEVGALFSAGAEQVLRAGAVGGVVLVGQAALFRVVSQGAQCRLWLSPIAFDGAGPQIGAMAVYRITPPQNPLGRALAAVVALLVLAGAFMLGLVVFAIVAGLAVIVGIVAWARGLFLRHSGAKAPSPRESPAKPSQTIEAEYTVISRRREP
jgi:hypothetical protein